MAPLLLPRPKNWQHIDRPQFSIANSLSSALRQMELHNPGCMPNIRAGSRVIVASDASGQLKGTSQYRVFSFCLLDTASLRRWRPTRDALRAHFLTKGQRISFKGMNDREQREIRMPYLRSTNSIEGVSVTFAVHKSIKSLFTERGYIDMSAPELEEFCVWKPGVFEHVERALNFVCLLLAGLTRSHQEIWWISDEDDMLANESQHRMFRVRWERYLRSYTDNEYRAIQIDTPKTGPRGEVEFIEDVLAIPDLVAGGVAEILTKLSVNQQMPTKHVMTIVPFDVQEKSTTIIDWFTDPPSQLKRLVCVFDRSDIGSDLRTRWMEFGDLADALPSRLVLPRR